MKQYRSIFFDLDHTLWDYDKNSRETLEEFYWLHKIDQQGNVGFDRFHDTFQQVNAHLWDQYDRGLIDQHVIRTERFQRVLSQLDIVDEDIPHRLSEQYMTLSPTRKNLVPHALEVLEYLTIRYPMFLVTNGFEEIQSTKVASGGIEKYFKEIITSEKAGHKKPSKEIFEYALRQSGHENHEAIMVGDNLLTDMAGAAGAGIDTVFYNPRKGLHTSTVTYEIIDLLELKKIL